MLKHRSKDHILKAFRPSGWLSTQPTRVLQTWQWAWLFGCRGKWVEAKSVFEEADILIMIYYQRRLVKMSPVLCKRLSNVEQLVRLDEFLSVEYEIDPDRPLNNKLAKQDLNQWGPLVAEIVDYTKSRDTLLSCPTGQMRPGWATISSIIDRSVIALIGR
jgi:hypothetical protein